MDLLHAVQDRASVSSALGAMEDKRYYDGERTQPKALAPDSTVLVWYPTRPHKFCSHWQGPYKVQSGPDAHGFYLVREMRAHGELAAPIPVLSSRLLAYDMSRTSFKAEAQRDAVRETEGDVETRARGHNGGPRGHLHGRTGN
jgi:hypothetical protein